MPENFDLTIHGGMFIIVLTVLIIVFSGYGESPRREYRPKE